MTATLVCRTCRTQLRSHAKFCDECGAATEMSALAAEYKQVTVLFADVVRSMDIAAAVGPERLREIMARLVDCAAGVVRRFSGTLDKFTGDGIMAVFGAPFALEDHALRACRAGLEIQREIAVLSGEVARLDGVDLRVRIGLSSGKVIAGEIGTTAAGYTAIGEQVGMAQRMESAAPPGGVMLSGSTARLVENIAVLAEPQKVYIKGGDVPVWARRLLEVDAGRRPNRAWESSLIGRSRDLAALASMLDRAMSGHTSIAAVVGTAGIGKTRLVGEAAQQAKSVGMDVISTFCESHATDVPFGVVTRLLRAVLQVEGLDAATARTRVRDQLPDADPLDLLLLNDLLGVSQLDVEMPAIDSDARRQRLTALITTAQVARSQPTLIVVEDAHWIDEASESMLADLLAIEARAQSMVILTYRPEYQGALRNIQGALTIALEPLTESETSMLVGELVGSDPSVAEISKVISERAAGNPFFAQEIIRDLTERDVLRGERGRYTCSTDVRETQVPATLQATLAARIDRLSRAAKLTLCAAAVVGFRFHADVLSRLEIEGGIEELIAVELIDRVGSSAQSEYAFRHPLIRSVAYESQLTSDRAQLHRRVAAAIEAQQPKAADQNAALIAEHLEAAGDLHSAYGWHMRAATWATNRDIAAARLSWERARRIADALPADDPQRATMQIAPRTRLCGIAYRIGVDTAADRFEELRELCAAAGDKVSLFVAMAGLVMDHAHRGRIREGSQLAREAMALIESIDDAGLTVDPSVSAIEPLDQGHDKLDAPQWSAHVAGLVDGDLSTSNGIISCPFALALGQRATVRYWLGRPGWRDDLDHSLAMARSADPMSYARVVSHIYLPGIPVGVLASDDRTLLEVEKALRAVEESDDELAVGLARVTLGIALVHRETDAERHRGNRLLAQVGEVFLSREYITSELPIVTLYLAREEARHGDRGAALSLMRDVVERLASEGKLASWGAPATAVLVESLLDRDADGDLAAARAAVDRLVKAPSDDPLAVRDVWLTRLEAKLAWACDETRTYLRLRDQYRDMAKRLGFDGHIGWAEAMP